MSSQRAGHFNYCSSVSCVRLGPKGHYFILFYRQKFHQNIHMYLYSLRERLSERSQREREKRATTLSLLERVYSKYCSSLSHYLYLSTLYTLHSTSEKPFVGLTPHPFVRFKPTNLGGLNPQKPGGYIGC